MKKQESLEKDSELKALIKDLEEMEINYDDFINENEFEYKIVINE